jgi:hypothetical protein
LSVVCWPPSPLLNSGPRCSFPILICARVVLFFFDQFFATKAPTKRLIRCSFPLQIPLQGRG